jgi:dephospho-CoA kinase
MSTPTLGITGGIGSGKTAACDRLAELGARVVYADLVARRLMEHDENLRSDLVAAFGPGTYDADGHLNRKALAAAVFGDPEKVERLNGIVHPRVRDAFFQEKREADEMGAPLFVYEAALLFESGADQHLDTVAVVDAPLEVRIERAMQRDGVPREAVLARMKHQLDPAAARARADVVLDNGGTLEDLNRQVDALYERLTGPAHL